MILLEADHQLKLHEQQQINTSGRSLLTSTLETTSINLRQETSESKTTYGIRSIEIPSALTLDDFLGFVMDCETISIPVGANCSLIAAHFENARAEILESSDLKTLNELELQSKYFEKEKFYGDNILEVTSAKFESEIVGSFRKLNFTGREGKSKLPDLTLRTGGSFSPRNRFGRTLGDTHSPTWRLCPWLVIGYVELKKWSQDLGEHVHQALYYAKSTLICCPNRKYCLTALYNFRSILFCAAIMSGDGIVRYYTSTIMYDEVASREFSKFVSCDHSLLGFVEYCHFDRYPPVKPLGRGSTAVCVSIAGPNNSPLALKIARDADALATERAILNYIHSTASTSTLKIPRIPPDASEVMESIFQIKSPPNATILCPVYRHRKEKYLGLQQLLDIWDTLRQVHQLGICHRDVRLPNIGSHDSTLHLMDWSSAKPFRKIESSVLSEISFHLGSTCTASIPVLNRMKSSPQDYHCYPSDEAISMIYLSFQCWTQDPRYECPIDHHTAASLWRNTSSKIFPSQVRDAVSTLEKISESEKTDETVEDPETSSIIDQLVKTALNVLFSKSRIPETVSTEAGRLVAGNQEESIGDMGGVERVRSRRGDRKRNSEENPQPHQERSDRAPKKAKSVPKKPTGARGRSRRGGGGN